MRVRHRPWLVVTAFALTGFALSGCAANPCSPRYYYTLNDGAVRRPPDQQACAKHSNEKRQADASLTAR